MSDNLSNFLPSLIDGTGRLLQLVSKYSDLSAVLALMSVVHIDDDIVQGISHAIPGKCPSLAELFRTNLLSQRHHLRICVIELIENLSHCSPFAFLHLSVVKLTAQFDKPVQVGCSVLTDKRRQYIYQDLFVGNEVGDDVLDRPDAACACCLPLAFGEAFGRLECRLVTVLQNVICVHWLFLSFCFSSAGRRATPTSTLVDKLRTTQLSAILRIGRPQPCLHRLPG